MSESPMDEQPVDRTPPTPEPLRPTPMGVADLLGITVDLDEVTEALREVIDPELGVNIVDLGLVYDAKVTDGVADILITTTTPACPLGPYLTDAIRWSLLRIDGILDVRIEVTYDPLWSPHLMTDLAKEQLGWRR